jgi:ribulose-5-phosphate 4-epimerase/fuculose-1-phosphate aldolase
LELENNETGMNIHLTLAGINQAGYILHTAVHEARPDVKCVLHMHTTAGAAVSSMKCGLLPINQGNFLQWENCENLTSILL